jgi:hypothetical protein
MLGNRDGRHKRTKGNGLGRAAVLLAAVTVPGVAVVTAGGWLTATPVMKAAAPTATARRASQHSTATSAALSQSAPIPAAALRSSDLPGDRPVLSRRARRSCPHAAAACVDLSDHATWLQSRGQVTFGPVRMEPGGRSDPTPRGVFHVAWKAGPHYISTSYGVPIPYAVFFAAGGIAFHAGSLSSSSHGCVHLTLHDARYYHDHLPIGAEVDVF